MRKEYLSAVAGAIALILASCSSDEPVAKNTTDRVISYTVATANQSRAGHSYDSSNKPKMFKVWAKDLFEDGHIIEKEKADESYTDQAGPQYWPVDKSSLSFYAVADGDSKKEENGNSSINSSYGFNKEGQFYVKDYTINEDVNKQLDLMYAVAADAPCGEDVSLHFHHALSQICFKARNETDKTIYIKSITVKNVNSKGDYILPPNSTTRDDATDNSTSSTSSVPRLGTWENRTGPMNFTISFENGKEIAKDKDIIDFGKEGAFNLLPRTKKDDESPASPLTPLIEISYSIDLEPNQQKNTIDVDIDWKEGYRYIYTIKFTTSTIKYTISAEGFKSVDLHPVINEHDAVLMREAKNGESALYFATANIGAENNEPNAPGLYFWWGGTIGYKHDISNGPNIFNNTNEEIVTNKPASSLTSYLDGNILKKECDAATIEWKEPWRMPTIEELQWLVANCSWEASKNENGYLLGYTVTSKTTGGKIYLPATGCFEDNYVPNNQEGIYQHMCFYWSATIGNQTSGVYTSQRLRAEIGKDGEEKITAQDGGLRYNGFPIRPVASTITSEGGNTEGTVNP